jgi:hypothetical protein
MQISQGARQQKLIVIALFLCSLHTDKNVDWITIHVHAPWRDTEISQGLPFIVNTSQDPQERWKSNFI